MSAGRYYAGTKDGLGPCTYHIVISVAIFLTAMMSDGGAVSNAISMYVRIAIWITFSSSTTKICCHLADLVPTCEMCATVQSVSGCSPDDFPLGAHATGVGLVEHVLYMHSLLVEVALGAFVSEVLVRRRVFVLFCVCTYHFSRKPAGMMHT